MRVRTTEPVASTVSEPLPTARTRVEPPRSAATPIVPPELIPSTIETAAIVGHLPVARRPIASSGLRVFPLAMSAKQFGSTVSDAVATDILDAYAALGGNMIDTADSYAAGASELIIGEWLRRRGTRDEMVVATKVGKSAEHPGLSARALTAAVEDSLGRLGTDRIDLLYLHIDDPAVAFDETLLAVDELIRAGKVLAFGGSDHTGIRLMEARIACAMLGVAPMVALQNEYSLMHRWQYEGDLARVAEQQGLAVMPRFPLAGGFLTGDYRTRADVAASPTSAALGAYLGRRGRRVLTALERVAHVHEASLATIALAWLLSKPHVVAPVVSATRPEQLFDLMGAPDIRLSRRDITALDRASA